MESGATSEHPAPAALDGRRMRREHGRLAVVDAVIDLMLCHDTVPTADQIADRAGVSVASVHRYFASLDDLRDVGIQRYFERIDDLLAIDQVGEGPLSQRVTRLVDARLDLYEASASIARHARRHAFDVAQLGATLVRVRSMLADQVAHHFAPELATVGPTARRDRVAVLASLTSFEAWDMLIAQGLTRPDIRRAWRTHLVHLLEPSGDTP